MREGEREGQKGYGEGLMLIAAVMTEGRTRCRWHDRSSTEVHIPGCVCPCGPPLRASTKDVARACRRRASRRWRWRE